MEGYVKQVRAEDEQDAHRLRPCKAFRSCPFSGLHLYQSQ